MFMFQMFLYGVLGAALSFMGIGIIEKPLECLVILSLTMAIDVTSKYSR